MGLQNKLVNIYLNPTKDQKEKSFFDSFVTLESNVPDGNWEKSEAPDYLLTTKKKVIGLELTTLTETKTQGKYKMTAVRTAQDEAITKAKLLAIKNNLPPLEAQIKFRNDRSGVDIDLASQELYKLVEDYLKNIDDSQLWYNYIDNSAIFSEFSIRLGTSKDQIWLPEHRWTRLHRNWVRMDPISEIQRCIDKKHKKLPDYLNKCNECWLLIGVEEWTAPEAFDISEKTLQHTFSTKFERIYFLRNSERKLYRLNRKLKFNITKILKGGV